MYGDGNKLQFQMFSLLQENIFIFFSRIHTNDPSLEMTIIHKTKGIHFISLLQL